MYNDDRSTALVADSMADFKTKKKFLSDDIILLSPKDKSITDAVIPDGVTTIARGAFFGCDRLVSIVIPESVKTVEEGALFGCSSLVSLTAPIIEKKEKGGTVSYPIGYYFGKESFDGAVRVVQSRESPDGGSLFENEYYIPSTLRELIINGSRSGRLSVQVSGLGMLTSLTLSYEISSICPGALSGLGSLTSLSLYSFGFTVGSDGLEKQYTLPELFGKSVYENSAVVNRKDEYGVNYYLPRGLSTVEVLRGVLPVGAFEGCSMIREVTVPMDITEIPDTAFFGCASLSGIELPDTVKRIGCAAFSECSALEALKLPDGLSVIDEYAFEKCCSLRSAELPSMLTSLCDYAFRECESLTEIVLPPSLTTPGSGVFSDCISLKKIELFDGMTELPCYFFESCSSLENIDLPETLRKICESAFYLCSLIERIRIPASVEDIDEAAFDSMEGLSEIIVDEGSESYYSIDGALYSSDRTALLKYPPKRYTHLFTVSPEVSYIGADAFGENSTLEEIAVKGINTDFSPEIFNNCYKLRSVDISPENLNFKSVDGVLYSRDGSELLFYPPMREGESFEIPEGVESIGHDAFRYAARLHTLTLPSGIKSIARDHVFGARLGSVKLLVLRAGFDQRLIDSINLPPLVFAEDERREKVRSKSIVWNYPTGCRDDNGRKYENQGGMIYCERDGMVALIHSGDLVGKIKIPDTVELGRVKEIKSSALSYRYNVEEIIIGSGVEIIDDGAFCGCNNLARVSVSSENSHFSARDGLLLDKDGTTLFGIAEAAIGKELTLPDTVKYLRPYSISSSILTSVSLPGSITEYEDNGNIFFGCNNLRRVVFGEGTRRIGERIFSGYCDIETVVLPHSILSLPKALFERYTRGETTVIYKGTREEFAGIENSEYFIKNYPYIIFEESSK